MDIFVGNRQNRPGSYLFQNNNGIFTDKAAVAGVQFPGRNAMTSAWADYDNDGLQDLYVGAGNYGGSFSRSYN